MHNSNKDSILEAVDIVALIGEKVALTRKGKDFVGLCPFHPDHKPSMGVSPTKQIFKCWSCGAGGDAIKYVQMRDRVEFREAMETLARWAGLEFQKSGADSRNAKLREQLLSTLKWAADHFQRNLSGRNGAAAREYAKARGLTPATLERFRIGLAPDEWESLFTAGNRAKIPPDVLQQAGLITTSEKGKRYDRFRNRLMFPIADATGRVVAFGGRTLGDDPAKYLNSPETALFSKSRVLYGLDLAREAVAEKSHAIVVEGYMDAVLLAQFGFDNVVATLGTALTDSHVRLLAPRCDSVFLCFDGDRAGIQAADRAAEIALRSKMDVRVVMLEGAKDPADCVLAGGKEAFDAALQSARPALEFKWSLAQREIRAGGTSARRAAVEAFVQFVARVAQAGHIDPVEQGLLVGRLSDLLEVPADAVYEMLAAVRPTRTSAAERATINEAPVSDYESAVRDLPPGVAGAAEELFGWLLLDSACLKQLDKPAVDVFGRCEVWRRFHGRLTDLARKSGEFTRQDVIAACDEPDLLELIQRATSHVDVEAAGEAPARFRAARARLASEVEVHRMADLRRRLSKADPQSADSDEAFRSFLELARRQDAGGGRDGGSLLPADRRAGWLVEAE